MIIGLVRIGRLGPVSFCLISLQTRPSPWFSSVRRRLAMISLILSALEAKTSIFSAIPGVGEPVFSRAQVICYGLLTTVPPYIMWRFLSSSSQFSFSCYGDVIVVLVLTISTNLRRNHEHAVCFPRRLVVRRHTGSRGNSSGFAFRRNSGEGAWALSTRSTQSG